MSGRTVTLATLDHGDVTLPEPNWCAGHTGHLPVHRVDLHHAGTEHHLSHRGVSLWTACLVQYPYATDVAPRSVHLHVAPAAVEGWTLDVDGVQALAAATTEHAQLLRFLARHLAHAAAGEVR